MIAIGEKMEDLEIIIGIRRGEAGLFRHLVERYHRPLLAFIYRLCRDRFLTEDIGQAVFLSFYRCLDRFDETRPTPVAAWLFAAARNLTINTMKKERRYAPWHDDKADLQDHQPGPLEQCIHREELARLGECLQLIGEPYRTTLLKSLSGRSIEEIAAQEMVLPGTVKSRLARAREKIIVLFRAKMAR